MLKDYYSKIETTYCRKINIKYDFNKCCGPCNKYINNSNNVLNTWGDTVLNIYGYMCDTCQYNRYNKMNNLINSNSKKEIDDINKDLLIDDNIIWKNVLESYIRLKKSEVESFKLKEKFDKLKPITKWERSNTLDC